MRERGTWGEITKEDREYYKVPCKHLSRLDVLSLAFRVAFSSFVDTLHSCEVLAMRTNERR